MGSKAPYQPSLPNLTKVGTLCVMTQKKVLATFVLYRGTDKKKIASKILKKEKTWAPFIEMTWAPLFS